MNADSALWVPGPCAVASASALGQWVGVHQPGLHATGARLWASPGVHHAALSAAERHGGAAHPDSQGAMRPSPPVRDLAARASGAQRLDRVLQQPPTAPGARYENTRRGLCLSGLR